MRAAAIAFLLLLAVFASSAEAADTSWVQLLTTAIGPNPRAGCARRWRGCRRAAGLQRALARRGECAATAPRDISSEAS